MIIRWSVCDLSRENVATLSLLQFFFCFDFRHVWEPLYLGSGRGVYLFILILVWVWVWVLGIGGFFFKELRV